VHLKYVAIAVSGPALTGFPTLLVLTVDGPKPILALTSLDFHTVNVFAISLPVPSLVVTAVGTAGPATNTSAIALLLDL
jgi:hypothetical protein